MARTHASKAADLKQSDELLMAQIESARTYEEDLKTAKTELQQERNSR